MAILQTINIRHVYGKAFNKMIEAFAESVYIWLQHADNKTSVCLTTRQPLNLYFHIQFDLIIFLLVGQKTEKYQAKYQKIADNYFKTGKRKRSFWRRLMEKLMFWRKKS